MSDEGGGWPADPNDPRCPECGGPVAATSSYCMHCQADLPAANFDVAEATTGIDADSAPADTGRVSAKAGGTGDAETDETGWFHPDGLLDDVSTAIVGIVGGLLAGAVVTGALLFPLPGHWPFSVGIASWLGATVWLARTRTVFGAIRKSGYLLGGLLVAFPVVFGYTAPLAENAGGDRFGLVVVLGIFTWPIAGIAVAVGYLGHRLFGDG